MRPWSAGTSTSWMNTRNSTYATFGRLCWAAAWTSCTVPSSSLRRPVADGLPFGIGTALAGDLISVEETKDEAAVRFAAGITRQPWKDQWAQLSRLQVGLAKEGEPAGWFGELESTSRCGIASSTARHVSSLLRQKTEYFAKKNITQIEIWPQHPDFYRRRFLECVGHIEAKIEAKYKAKH